jgi:hypothetical protein
LEFSKDFFDQPTIKESFEAINHYNIAAKTKLKENGLFRDNEPQINLLRSLFYFIRAEEGKMIDQELDYKTVKA